MVNILPQRKKRINKKCSLKALEQIFVAISFLSILFVIYYNFSISKSFESASTPQFNHIKQTDCTQYHTKFLSREISEVEEQKGFAKAYITRTTSSYPFYWSTHSPELDPIRKTSFDKGNYYEFQLSMRVIEAIEEGKKKGYEVIFLDVGANIGWFSLLARSYGATHVYSFEPNPVNVLRMCESLTLNNWKDDSVHIMQMGVGNKDEKKILHQFNPNPGAFTFDEVRISNYKDKEKAVGEFQIKKLDTFAEEMGWFQRKQRIAFFKLDVEGYEHAVIEGATKLIEARLIQYVSFEFNAKRGYKEVEPMISVFFESGYELYMHGRMRGPSNKVGKKYSLSSDLTSDIISGTMYGENLLFRLK